MRLGSILKFITGLLFVAVTGPELAIASVAAKPASCGDGSTNHPCQPLNELPSGCESYRLIGGNFKEANILLLLEDHQKCKDKREPCMNALVAQKTKQKSKQNAAKNEISFLDEGFDHDLEEPCDLRGIQQSKANYKFTCSGWEPKGHIATYVKPRGIYKYLDMVLKNSGSLEQNSQVRNLLESQIVHFQEKIRTVEQNNRINAAMAASLLSTSKSLLKIFQDALKKIPVKPSPGDAKKAIKFLEAKRDKLKASIDKNLNHNGSKYMKDRNDSLYKSVTTAAKKSSIVIARAGICHVDPNDKVCTVEMRSHAQDLLSKFDQDVHTNPYAVLKCN
jgi:hypothetical protein